MIKIIDKIKTTDMRKKIVIGFITISFIFIVGIGSYRSIYGESYEQQSNDIAHNIEIDNDNNLEDTIETITDSQEQKNETKKEETSKDKNTQSQSHVTTNKTSSQEETKNTTNQNNKTETDNSNQSVSKEENDKDINKTIQINITIKGLNSQTIASDHITLQEKSSVYTALDQLSKNKGLKIEKTKSILGIYIVGINDLKEKEHGATSGWTYYVNGVFANKSCDAYIIKNNDSIEWVYQYE